MKYLLIVLFFITSLCRGVDLYTAQTDLTRGSYNSLETILTPETVSSSLNLLGSFSLDGAPNGQQLFVTIGTQHCLLIVTSNNTVYCGDVDNPGSFIWHNHLSSPRISFGSLPTNFLNGEPNGCLSTPLIDVGRSKIYAVCEISTGDYVLYTLDLSTGALLNSQIVVGQFPGTGCTGDTKNGSNVVFSPANHIQRVPLTLVGNILIVAFSSWGDVPPWHGWMMPYDVDHDPPVPLNVLNITPNGCGGGIWGSSGGIASDGTYLYFSTGNGDYDGVNNFGEAVLKVNLSSVIVDWWVASNYVPLNNTDSDISSGRVMIIPGTNYVTFGSKDFYVRLIDKTNMGHLVTPPQQFLTNPSPPTLDGETGIFGGAFGNGMGYFPNLNGFLYGFSFNGSVYNTTPVKTSRTFASVQGLTISSNAGIDAILWAVTTDLNASNNRTFGILRAFDPITLHEIWNSGSLLGDASKFSAPTVLNGNVFVGSADHLVRMFSTISGPPQIPFILGKISVTLLGWKQQ